MRRLRRFELVWDRGLARWQLLERQKGGYASLIRSYPGLTKATADSISRRVVREFAPATYRQRNRNGRYAKGDRGEATYARADDPRASRG